MICGTPHSRFPFLRCLIGKERDHKEPHGFYSSDPGHWTGNQPPTGFLTTEPNKQAKRA